MGSRLLVCGSMPSDRLIGCDPGITRFVLSGECRARAASHWRSGGCHRGTRSGLSPYISKSDSLLSDAITGYVDVKLTFTQERAYMLQEYDQQSDS